ncbi:CAZyme family AA1 [Penicillium hispanicum]|uniref:CAZyme family AA1 n=1 Tax=Penicillium hispanicum TaxID=1080232 RepID=UPI00253FAA97|nr:CAZyme family AA1 [Penicillium hispanicum]KAJ5584591.1 CAZyme family AA1 [Penicillium hispanicum]
MKLQAFLITTSALSTAAFYLPFLESRSLEPRDLISPKPKRCPGNVAIARHEWCEYSIHTDYTTIVPETGVTREYWFSIEEKTIAPDGIPRFATVVNGTFPGPTVYADWGDEIIVHVTNRLNTAENGSSIHWHGIRQNYTNSNDGVVSITQCPTAPGSSTTYKWRAVQYGSSWYHSHIGLQAWEGVFGGIVINGPASANYDEDKGVLFLNDWSHLTADELYTHAQTVGPPTLDTGLINGTNVYNSTGSRFTMGVNQGKSYRLRLVNAAVDTLWKFMIDDHVLTIIAMDFVPIRPYTTQYINIGVGQRYDVIVTAKTARVADNFWIRAIPQTACSENDNVDDIKGILHYHSRVGIPQTNAYHYTDGCVDEDLRNLVPIVPKSIEPADWESMEDVTVGKTTNNLFRWYLNDTSMEVEWNDPTLLQIYDRDTHFPNASGVIEVPKPNEWVYLLINTTIPVAHPIHLHGHDFFILAQGVGAWDGSIISSNPPRRDTAMLMGRGHLLIAFETDNPGAWLMHCHIGWHQSMGLALQFVERYDEIKSLIDYQSLKQGCDTWKAYDTALGIEQEDSGI